MICLILVFWFLILLSNLLSNLFFNTVTLNSENRCISTYSRLILCCLALCSDGRYLVPHNYCATSSNSWVKIRFFLPFLSQDTLVCLGKDLGFVLSDRGQAHVFLKALRLVNRKPSVFDSDLNYSTLC